MSFPWLTDVDAVPASTPRGRSKRNESLGMSAVLTHDILSVPAAVPTPPTSANKRIRKTFVMKLNDQTVAGKPDHIVEYARRHDGTDPVYLPLEAEMKKNGVHNYSIHFHEPTRMLFAFAELDDEQAFERVAETDACKAWWKYMDTGAQKYGEDGKPWADELREVFFMA